MTKGLLSGKKIVLETHNSSKHDGGVALYLPDLDKLVTIQAERVDRIKHSGTARIQTVTREENEIYYDLIKRFGDMNIDYLVIGNHFINRK